jgi:hypothetical protein
MKPIRYFDFFLTMSRFIKKFGTAPRSVLRWRRSPFTYSRLATDTATFATPKTAHSAPAAPNLQAVFLCKLKLGHGCINRHSNLISDWLMVPRSPVYFTRTDSGRIIDAS